MQERLQKIISRAGIASRRHAEELISSGQVRVNGVVVSELGAKADPETDHVEVAGKLAEWPAEPAYYMLHKPVHVVSTMSDPEGRATLRHLLRGLSGGIYPVGRLDYASSGLLLLTSDGELANRIFKVSGSMPKVYWIKIKGRPSDDLLANIRHRAHAHLRLLDAPGAAKKDADNPWYEVEMGEARRDLLRRALFSSDHPVEKMKRVKLGPLDLGDLPEAHYRKLDPAEVIRLRQAVERAENAPRPVRTGGKLTGPGNRRYKRMREAPKFKPPTPNVDAPPIAPHENAPVSRLGPSTPWSQESRGQESPDQQPQRPAASFTSQPPQKRSGGFTARPSDKRHDKRSGGFTGRPPVRRSGGFTPPDKRSGGFTSRPSDKRNGGFAGRPPDKNRGTFTGRPDKRNGGFRGRPPDKRSGRFTARPTNQRGGSFTGKPSDKRGGGFADRPPHKPSGGFTGRPPDKSRGSFSSRPPDRRSGGLTGRPPEKRAGGFTGRPPDKRGGSFTGRPPNKSRSSFRGRPPDKRGGSFAGRPPFKPNRGFAGKRPSKPNAPPTGRSKDSNDQ